MMLEQPRTSVHHNLISDPNPMDLSSNLRDTDFGRRKSYTPTRDGVDPGSLPLEATSKASSFTSRSPSVTETDPLKLENFYVVEHEFKVKDKEPEVLLSLAHIDWLDLENDKAHSPPTRLLRNKKLFENPPSADKVKKWTLHECKQLIGPLDYYAAWEKSKEMSGKSGVSEQEEGDTEDDSGAKKSRKRKVPIRFSPPLKSKKFQSRLFDPDSSESSSSSENDNPPPDDSDSSDDSDDADENDDSCEDDESDENEEDGENEEEDDQDDDEDEDKRRNNQKEKSNDGFDNQQNAINQVLKTRNRNQSKTVNATTTSTLAQKERYVDGWRKHEIHKNGFKTLHEEIQNVNAKVEDFLEKSNKRLSKQAKLLPKFPLKGAKGVVALERKLAKKKFREIFEKKLESIGGYSSTNFVRNIFRKIFAPKLQEKFSWTGRRTKKCPFKDLRICRSIVGEFN
ncbi:hypothetical protein QAD02_020761 [Eretmocerus hayati]|uniref:Uncharacterized protein n=1 Tax=Eretmocerus hayati TaxID=131215 RepID=A0ACC2PNC8_9HYME|nr:hypothetical protein QAD02_020761 [Eretmocerus hayati]